MATKKYYVNIIMKKDNCKINKCFIYRTRELGEYPIQDLIELIYVLQGHWYDKELHFQNDFISGSITSPNAYKFEIWEGDINNNICVFDSTKDNIVDLTTESFIDRLNFVINKQEFLITKIKSEQDILDNKKKILYEQLEKMKNQVRYEKHMSKDKINEY